MTKITKAETLKFALALIAAGLFPAIHDVAVNTWGESRTKELVEWAIQAQAKYEGEVANPEQQPPIDEPATLDAIDAAKVTMIGKNRIGITGARVIPGSMKGAKLEGGNVRYDLALPASWWIDRSNPLKGPRLHIYWPSAGGYVGGHYEWTSFPGQSVKTLKNIPNGYMGAQPPAGSVVYFCTISHDGKERTPIIEAVGRWK